jgi:hypothetical protein
MKLIIMQFSPVFYFMPLWSTCSQNPILKDLGLCSSLIVRDQVSHPCRTTGKSIVLDILIFTFLESRRDDEKSWTELPELDLLISS